MSDSARSRRPTLADVAAAAGVSPVTVSRALNGNCRVSEKTTARIHRAIEEIGYFGNAAASHLGSGRSQTIGVLTSWFSDYGYAKTIEGIEKRAREKGFSVLISIMELGSEEGTRKSVASVASQVLAGVIALDYDKDSSPVIAALPDYLPVVVASGPVRAETNRRPTIAIDDFLGAQEATRYLLELGHETVFMIGPPNVDADQCRTEGLATVLAEYDRPLFPIMKTEDWSPSSGYEAMTQLLNRYGKIVTAVLCGNDNLAMGAISAIHNAGLRVPEDVSVIGFDDSPVAGLTLPPLTTVQQDFLSLGKLAVDQLVKAMDNPDSPSSHDVVGPQLVERDSTAIPNPSRGLLLSAQG